MQITKISPIICLIFLFILVSYLLFGIQMIQVKGESMTPTLDHGHWIIVDTLQVHWRSPKSGDIVLFKNENQELIVKRVVLTEKSQLLWQDNRLYIPINQEFIHLHSHAQEELTQASYLKANRLFMMGDNSTNSYDSRFYGTIPKEQIIGRVIGKGHI